ncbi:DUF4157 domain-containing protein [Streptomyces spectabilis]|uniref:eCIS core domain-containing protein n=1 Tax=Streptomyces spectabilis TaxID=68270 RepID=UPI0033FDD2E9
MTIQRLAGNGAVARLLEEERHAHGPGCGHGGAQDGGATDHQALINDAINSPTSSLPGPLIARAESFHQNDFSAAQFHMGPVAQRAIEAMGARAMTIGAHVFLPPGATQDLSLIGHEFSHLDKNFRNQPETGVDNGSGMPVTVQRAAADGADHTDPGRSAPVQRAARDDLMDLGGAGGDRHERQARGRGQAPPPRSLTKDGDVPAGYGSESDREN